MRDPTRRAMLSLGLLVPPLSLGCPPAAAAPRREANSAAARLSPWNGVAFTAQSGVNVVPLAFEIYQPVSIASWDAALPDARLVALRAAGFDHLRVAFDPTPALAASTAAALAAVMATAKHAIETTLRCGLKAILDLHVAAQGDWSITAIEADYPAGPKWQRYLEVARGFGEFCASYPTEQLAFEVYNENSNNESFGNKRWAVRVQAIWAAVRSVNLKTTLLVGGSFYSSIEGLQDLKASDFDTNTGFVVHNYNPAIFTHQDAANYTRYVQRLHYPPIASDKAAAIEDTAARIDGSKLAPADKAHAKADRSRRLGTYFNTPQGPDYILRKVREIADWQARNGIPGSRVFVTEFGSHNDHDWLGAALIARMAWTQDVDRAHQDAGYCRTVWNYNSPDYWDITEEDGSWRPRPGFLLSLGQTPVAAPEPEAEALMAATAHPPSAADRALINETIRQLKDHDLWAKLEALFVFAGPGGVPFEWKRAADWPSAPGRLSVTQGSGFANLFHTAGAIDFAGGPNPWVVLQPGAGHLGLLTVGNAAAASIDVRWGNSAPFLQLSPGGRVTVAGTVGTASGDATLLHALVSYASPSDSALYVNGSGVGPAGFGPAASESPLALDLVGGNRADCAVLHVGRVLSPQDCKTLFTILRWYVNGSARDMTRL